MAQEVTYNYTSRELKGIELTPNAKTEGIIFFPAVEIDSVQILISSETVEIPIRSKIAARLDRKEPHDFLRSEGARITQPQPSQPKPEPQPQFQTPPQVTETIQGQVVSASEYRDRGFEYYKNAQYNQAIENFTIALSMENNSSYYINRGSSFYELNQYDKAISDFKQAITLAPDKAKAYGWCGNAYYATKSYREASEYFSKAIALEPNNAVLYLNRGHAYAKIGNKSMAASDFKKACELGDEDGCKQLKVLESTQ
jgi:tetratricopeptide (TPR) repeat protein